MGPETAHWLLSTIIQATAMMIALTVAGGVFYYERMIRRLTNRSREYHRRQSFIINLLSFAGGIILMAMMVLYGAWIMVDAAHLLSDVLGGVEDLSEDLESNVVSVEASFTYFVFLTATVLILWFITLLYGLIQWASERLAGAP